MKQYKLIKEYPGSPKLNSVYKYQNESCYINTNPVLSDTYLSKKIIENNHEFWQEVVEYPIKTRVYNSQTNSFYTREKDGWYNLPEKTSYTDDIITRKSYINIVKEKNYEILVWCNPNNSVITSSIQENSSWIIKSVKRLSDNVTFKVGDLCKPLKSTLKPSEINSINICNINDLFITGKTYSCNINNLEHVKQPLFTTEDGVEIFKGDIFWNTKMLKLKELQVTNNEYSLLFLKDGSKSFFNKEKAEEYILMNKSCLSIDDLMKLGVGKTFLNQTIKLVKSKL